MGASNATFQSCKIFADLLQVYGRSTKYSKYLNQRGLSFFFKNVEKSVFDRERQKVRKSFSDFSHAHFLKSNQRRMSPHMKDDA